MRNFSAAEFEQQLLVAGLGVRHMVVGHDFHYARKREGNIHSLRAAGERHGFSVEEVGEFLVAGERVSSSLVREALGRNDMERAAHLLGRPYRMTGRVRRGVQLGRTLGYPTANLALHRKVVPLWGILAVRVSGAGLQDHPAVVSLGTRPTVNGTDPLLEVHLFDLRGRPLRRIPERRFPALAAGRSRSSSRWTRWSCRWTSIRPAPGPPSPKFRCWPEPARCLRRHGWIKTMNCLNISGSVPACAIRSEVPAHG